ncbi:alkaline-phosphatase-like protein, partial [Trichoderma sp. TUCIM 5745]
MAKEHHCNIVQLVADDLGLMLGCYGLQAIKTPNIDRLASQGTRFTQAFASIASCSGSRSTIYTGLHTHQNGQYGLNHGWNHVQTHEHVETLRASSMPWDIRRASLASSMFALARYTRGSGLRPATVAVCL